MANITLEDVNNAIRILEYYLGQMNRAKAVLARMNQLSGGRGTGGIGGFANLSFDDIVNMSVAVEQKKRGIQPGGQLGGGESQELTDEEVQRMKDSVAKVRKQEQTATQQ